MKSYKIVFDMPGRLRIRYGNYAFDSETAVALRYEIKRKAPVTDVQANDITGSLLITYEQENRDELISYLDDFDLDGFDKRPYMALIKENNSYELMQKEMSRAYVKKFAKMIGRRYILRLLLPVPCRRVMIAIKAAKYIKAGLISLKSGHIDVPVLDATSITTSMLNGNFKTARDIMFLLSISELLEDYTKKKTSLQLKETLSLNIDKVWILREEQEIQIPTAELNKGDIVIVNTGQMVPVDGEIQAGEAMINESSFTGEPLSKHVSCDDTVFAGTVVEEGRIFVKVRNLQSESRINKIVDMIDSNESLKASIQSKAEHLADSIVPYSFLAFFGLLAATRSLTRACSVLLVDYSCAIKLSTSISVISAMQEAGKQSIMIKGGKYLESMAEADTIVFDKTGTLTNASPFVKTVMPCEGYTRNEVLKIAACLEEHFPHSVANAIVKQAQTEGLNHREEHAKVEYIIAHGIATSLYGKRTIIGSEHFIFEDEGIKRTAEIDRMIETLQNEGANSLIYLAVGDSLAGIISIYDPLKPESAATVQQLRKAGFNHIVMLTGDCENAASHIADELGITEYRSGMLPEDKAEYIKQLKSEGHTVVMVGDGVNDTPALSCADVSISMQDSSDIARELADVTLTSGNLADIVTFRELSVCLMNRIKNNYTGIVTFNSVLIGAGLLGLLQPGTSAFLHNASTFGFAISSTRKLIKGDKSKQDNKKSSL